MSARCASVSTFCTSVGAPRRPRRERCGGVAVGVGTPRWIQCTTALAWPATNRSAAVRTSSRTRPERARTRSATASATISRTPRCTTTTALLAPIISAASTAPSRTSCGDRAMSTRSFALAGSPSVPFATTTGACPAATAASLRAVGNPAPPRPVSPARSTSSISASRCGRPRPEGGGPYLAVCSARLAGPAACPGPSRRGSAPASSTAAVTGVPFPPGRPGRTGQGDQGAAARTAGGRARPWRPRRGNPRRPPRPTRSAGRCLP